MTDVFNLGRFGEIAVAPQVNDQPTQVIDPVPANLPAIAALAASNAASNAAERLIVDDGSNVQNRDVKTLIDDGAETGLVDGAYDVADTTDLAGPTLRLGAGFDRIEGVLDFAFGDFRLQYDLDASGPLTPNAGTNDRPAVPDVGGELQVATFNVGTFFTTLDDGSLSPIGAPPRGADNTTEFARQLEALAEAIDGLGAEVVGLQELENNGFGPD